MSQSLDYKRSHQVPVNANAVSVSLSLFDMYCVPCLSRAVFFLACFMCFPFFLGVFDPFPFSWSIKGNDPRITSDGRSSLAHRLGFDVGQVSSALEGVLLNVVNVSG